MIFFNKMHHLIAYFLQPRNGKGDILQGFPSMELCPQFGESDHQAVPLCIFGGKIRHYGLQALTFIERQGILKRFRFLNEFAQGLASHIRVIEIPR
jgi:hypothetical protein